MSIPKDFKRIEIVNNHIVTKCKGNIMVLAHKLGLSRSGAYNVIKALRGEGFPTDYSKKEKLFYYSVPGRMVGYVFVRDKDDSVSDSSKNPGEGVKDS